MSNASSYTTSVSTPWPPCSHHSPHTQRYTRVSVRCWRYNYGLPAYQQRLSCRQTVRTVLSIIVNIAFALWPIQLVSLLHWCLCARSYDVCLIFFLTGWCRGHISLTQSRYSQWVISKSSPTGLWWRRPLPSRGTIESYMWVLKEFFIDVIHYSIALYCQRYYYFLELTIAVFMTRFTIHDTFHDS